MNNNVKDLEVLSKYLSEEELKEVAREVARGAFMSTLGYSNPHNKANLDFYLKHGAYEAVRQFAEENSLIDYEEMSKTLNNKVNAVIKGLKSYSIPYQEIIKEQTESRAEDIKRQVDAVLSELLNDKESYSGVYKKVEGDLGYIIAERLMEHLKTSLLEK